MSAVFIGGGRGQELADEDCVAASPIQHAVACDPDNGGVDGSGGVGIELREPGEFVEPGGDSAVCVHLRGSDLPTL